MPFSSTTERATTVRRSYQQVFAGVPIRGFEPIRSSLRNLPIAQPLYQAEVKTLGPTGLGAIALGTARVFMLILGVICLVGLAGVGLFLRGR
jgi:hypothetical protein